MLISGDAGAHEDDRLEEGNEIIHKPRSYFKNATDKALAGEIKVMWERIIFGLIVVFMSLPWIIVLGKITNKL